MQFGKERNILQLYLLQPWNLFEDLQTGPYEITTRWTMTMNFWIVLWKPQLIFTGVSIMRVNPETGKFCAHIVSFINQPAVVIFLTEVYHPNFFDNLFHHRRFSLSIIIHLALWLRW